MINHLCLDRPWIYVQNIYFMSELLTKSKCERSKISLRRTVNLAMRTWIKSTNARNVNKSSPFIRFSLKESLNKLSCEKSRGCHVNMHQLSNIFFCNIFEILKLIKSGIVNNNADIQVFCLFIQPLKIFQRMIICKIHREISYLDLEFLL